jgi:hypothetical protein
MNRLSCSISDVDCLIDASASDLQSAFTSQNGWLNPPCRDGCQVAPVVDSKVLEEPLGAMSYTARRIPTLSGFCLDDGADFVMMDVTMLGTNMSEKQYHTWWSHFRGTGFDAERDEYFNVNDYTAQGSASNYFMAANDAYSTALYSCPVH